ncbi:hypothetical protein DL767_009383 [Monosporascus sp. MG133]|nr:hypothetical protein DL767_009383 [Monosporascus sp. MG133]
MANSRNGGDTWPPFFTKVLETEVDDPNPLDASHPSSEQFLLPASYHFYEGPKRKKYRMVANPANSVPQFLERELSLKDLDGMLKHLWFAGSKHPATQLHFQVAMGREIVVADRMDLHLLWDNNGRIFIKPIPRFLLDVTFWRSNLKCPNNCTCENPVTTANNGDAGVLPFAGRGQPSAVSCMGGPRKVALGFLYTYACLIASESDFFVANEKRLLPRKVDDSIIEWVKWTKLVRELLENHQPNKVHPRFLRAELRLSRINTINRFTRFPPFEPYLRGWRNYSSLFRDNLAWMASATVFIAVVLTAMQVGLATERLGGDADFQRASYGFAAFAILGPMCAFGLVVLGALFNLTKDLPWLFAQGLGSKQDAILGLCQKYMGAMFQDTSIHVDGNHPVPTTNFMNAQYFSEISISSDPVLPPPEMPPLSSE